MPFTDLPSLRNLALAAPGIILLAWFLIVYQSVHYGGRIEASQPPRGPVTVTANDYKP